MLIGLERECAAEIELGNSERDSKERESDLQCAH